MGERLKAFGRWLRSFVVQPEAPAPRLAAATWTSPPPPPSGPKTTERPAQPIRDPGPRIPPSASQPGHEPFVADEGTNEPAYKGAATEVTTNGRVLHERARYEENGEIRFVHFSDLEKDEIFYGLAKRLEAKQIDLRTSDGLFPLHVRDGGKTRIRHFAMNPDAEGKRVLLERPENNQFHNERIQELIELLNTRSRFKIHMRIHGNPPSFKTLATIPSYEWSSNEALHFANGYIRPDITGRCYSSHQPNSAPAIFVEVINTHPPSEAAWEAYKAYTKDVPAIVLFDFPKKTGNSARNYSFKVDTFDRTIRGIFYITDGELWQNDQQLAGFTARQFAHHAKGEFDRRIRRDFQPGRPVKGRANGSDEGPKRS